MDTSVTGKAACGCSVSTQSGSQSRTGLRLSRCSRPFYGLPDDDGFDAHGLCSHFELFSDLPLSSSSSAAHHPHPTGWLSAPQTQGTRSGMGASEKRIAKIRREGTSACMTWLNGTHLVPDSTTPPPPPSPTVHARPAADHRSRWRRRRRGAEATWTRRRICGSRATAPPPPRALQGLSAET